MTDRIDSIYDGPVFTIETGGSTLEVTAYHPFWVLAGRDLDERTSPHELLPNEGEGLSLPGRWVNSHELRAGDVLIDRQGQPQTVVSISQRYESEFPVSNLTIGDFHNFAVGQEGILVHNESELCEKGREVIADVLRNQDSKSARKILDQMNLPDNVYDDILKRANHPPRVNPAADAAEAAGLALSNTPDSLIAQAKARAAEIVKAQSGAERGPNLSLVRDPKTGKVFESQNLRTFDPTDLDPVVKARYDKLMDDIASGKVAKYDKWTDGGLHSEIKAASDAMIYRRKMGLPVNDAVLDELEIVNINLRGKTTGQPRPCCPYCKRIFPNSTDVGMSGASH